jgi:hypothetical protein
VRDAGVVHDLVRDTPLRRRSAVGAPVVMLEGHASRTQVLDAAQKRKRHLRELVELRVGDHEPRVGGRHHQIAEPRR